MVAARAMLLSGLGPRDPGSAGVLVTDVAGNDGGIAGQTVFARGGPGALTTSLMSSARSFGAIVRTGAAVAAVRRLGESAVGVTLASGETIDASTVVSSLDPKTTLLNLIDPEALGPRLSWRASNIRQRGATAKVNFALRDLPRFPGAESDQRLIRGRILLAPSMASLDEVARHAKYLEVADEPLIEATIPTLADQPLVDEARAGAVKHVLSAVVQGVPLGPRRTWARSLRERSRVTRRASATWSSRGRWSRLATSSAITARWAGTQCMPRSISSQWFEWRPLHGYGRYRMPLKGMYLAGSGAHPGGGVTGAPGYLAAHEILADLRASQP